MSKSTKSTRSSGSVKQTATINTPSATRKSRKAVPFKVKICGYVRKIFSKVLRNKKERPPPSVPDSSDQTAPDAAHHSPAEDATDIAEPSHRRLADMNEEEKEDWCFGDVRKVEAEKLIRLAVQYLGAAHGDECMVADAMEGSYNRVNIMLFADDTRCTIRIPAHGTVDKWTKEDAFALRSQALTMNLIKRKTNVPVPQVIAYSDTCENELGHPYILTSFLQGKQVFEVWGDEDDYGPKIEAKRLRILRSLAHTMSKLQALSFDAAGGLYFEHDLDDSPKIGPKYDLDEPDFFTRNTSFIPSYNNTFEHLNSELADWWESLDHNDEVQSFLNTGRSKILQLALDCIPFHNSQLLVNGEDSDNVSEDEPEASDGDLEPDPSKAENMVTESDSAPLDEQDEEDTSSNSDVDRDEEHTPETFVLVPPDFDWQNILVDDDDNVTGLLDWDGICTVPRFQGFAASPLWLHRDYEKSWKWEGDISFSDWDLGRYRKVYAGFMAEALDGKGDCIYTAKSHLFETIQWGVQKEKCHSDTATRSILQIILPRSDLKRYLIRIGDEEKEGFQPGEMLWLRKRFGELFECKPGPDNRFCI